MNSHTEINLEYFSEHLNSLLDSFVEKGLMETISADNLHLAVVEIYQQTLHLTEASIMNSYAPGMVSGPDGQTLGLT